MKISFNSVSTLAIIALISISNVLADQKNNNNDKITDESATSTMDDKSMNLYKKMIARRREV